MTSLRIFLFLQRVEMQETISSHVRLNFLFVEFPNLRFSISMDGSFSFSPCRVARLISAVPVAFISRKKTAKKKKKKRKKAG